MCLCSEVESRGTSGVLLIEGSKPRLTLLTVRWWRRANALPWSFTGAGMLSYTMPSCRQTFYHRVVQQKLFSCKLKMFNGPVCTVELFLLGKGWGNARVVALAQVTPLRFFRSFLYCLFKGCAGIKQWLKLTYCKTKWPPAAYCTQIVIVGRWQTRLT